MATLYPVKTNAGLHVLPTADASHFTDLMSADYGDGQLYIEFFSDAAGTIPATPTGGTIAVAGTPTGVVYLAAGNVATITASAVTAIGTYEPPRFVGCVIKGRITFASITGAAYARASFWRS